MKEIDNKRLKLSLDASQMNIWEWHIPTNEVWEYGYFDPLSYLDPADEHGTFEHFETKIYPTHRQKVLEHINKFILSKNEEYCIEFQAYITKNKIETLEWLDVRGQIYFDDNDNPLRMRGTAAIITHRKIIETSIHAHQMTQISAERSTYVHEMTSTLTHELAQPLTAINLYITGCMQRLKKQPHDIASILANMRRIKENAMRANEIIIKINDMTNNLPIARNNLCINSVIESTLELFQHLNQNDLIRYELILTDNLPLLSIDQTLIGQVVYNLIRNAMDAILLKNTISPVISVSTIQDAVNYISVIIKDNGPGIQTDLIDQVFDPYFSTKSSGMGLGLSICRKIIDAHEGCLFIKNNSELGACFQFNLPIYSELKNSTQSQTQHETSPRLK